MCLGDREKAQSRRRSVAAAEGGRTVLRMTERFAAGSAVTTHGEAVARRRYFCLEGSIRVEYEHRPGMVARGRRDFDILGRCAHPQVRSSLVEPICQNGASFTSLGFETIHRPGV